MTNEPYNQLSCQALSPHEPREAPFPTPTPTPNVAHNSPRSVFITTHKRCNSNDPIYMFERFTWELRATLLGNHNVRRPKPQTEKISHIKTPQGPKAPAPHATPPEAAPKRECCTRYGTMHPIRGTAPDQKRCITYGSGAAPQHTRTNAELANQAAPGPHDTRAQTHETAPASSHGDRGRGRGWLSGKARRSAYSLTPPAVRPETMYFCRYWNSRITGMAAITEPAAKMPHGAVRSSDAHMYMPTARVN